MVKKQKNGDIQVYVEESYFRHVDQLERWRQEYEHNLAVENKLASVSQLEYHPVDYTPMLVRVPWKERVIPNFEYLLDEARISTESKFFMPIAARIAVLIVLIFMLVVSDKATVLWVAATLGAAVAGSLYLAIIDRSTTVKSVLVKTKMEIEERQAAERQKNELARKEHEQNEDERIQIIERLLNGDPGSIVLRLDNVLTKLSLPFPLEIDVDIYNNIPVIKVWLPPKLIIPTQSCTILSSGRIEYEEKEQRFINKQYLELCTSILMRVAAAIYANIPVFNDGYVWGMGKEYMQNICYFTIVANREKITKACQCANGLSAIQSIQGVFEFDTALNLKGIETSKPSEWKDAAPQLIRSLNVKIFK